MAQQGNKVAILKLAGIVVGVVVLLLDFGVLLVMKGISSSGQRGGGRRGLVLLEVESSCDE
jgi:hypothetical protein